MADVAGAVGTFLTLATGWYQAANARGTASATFDNHYKNFKQYHEHVKGPIESLFDLHTSRRNPLHLYQAIRVLHLLIDLRAWLTDAGFSTARRSTIIAVVPRNSASVPSDAYLIRRQQKGNGHLVHPLFGLTEKEVAFITLFERIRAAYERLEDSYPLEAYQNIPDPVHPAHPYMYDPRGPSRVGPGMRGGNNSELDGESEQGHPRPEDHYTPGSASRRPERHRPPNPDAGGIYEDDYVRPAHYGSHPGGRFRQRPRHYPERAAPSMPVRAPTAQTGSFHLTERQKMREDEMMQNLSQRLEKDISEMMISNGDTKKARKRKHQRRPLEKARRKVLKEQLLQEEFEDEQDVRAETRRAQDEAAALRSMRLSRPPYARTDIGETLGSEDEDYIVLRPYPAPPDQMEPESEQHRVERELREKSKSEQHAVRDEQKKVAFERELLRKQRQAFDVERNQFEEERRRQHQDDKIRRERSEREREHEVRRRRSEGPRREREQDERVRSEQDEDSRVARVYEEPRHRRRRGGRMSFF